jgi:hypothetical protein
MEEAKAAIKAIEPENEGNAKGSPILNGQASGGPDGKAELAPKNFVLGSHETAMKRTL